MMYETMIEKVFKKYIDMKGYIFSDDDLRQLVEVYLDCQEWDDEKPLTGMTETEMVDWVKHTGEVVRILAKNEKTMSEKGMSKKKFLEIDTAS